MGPNDTCFMSNPFFRWGLEVGVLVARSLVAKPGRVADISGSGASVAGPLDGADHDEIHLRSF